MRYKQCEFRRGTTRTTAWIPAWTARLGNLVQLKASEGSQVYWTVINVGDIELDEAAIRKQEHHGV